MKAKWHRWSGMIKDSFISAAAFFSVFWPVTTRKTKANTVLRSHKYIKRRWDTFWDIFQHCELKLLGDWWDPIWNLISILLLHTRETTVSITMWHVCLGRRTNVFVMAKAFMPSLFLRYTTMRGARRSLSTLFPNSVCFMRRVEKSWVPLSAIWGKHTSLTSGFFLMAILTTFSTYVDHQESWFRSSSLA